MEMFTMKINGREVEVPKGKTILQACQLHGIKIPTLCYDEELRAVGSCRICVVEAVGRPMMLAACVTPAEPNMDILTDSDAVRSARKINLELMSASHQFNCQVCEKNADCRLQDYCYEYGVDTEKYSATRHEIPVTDQNPFIKRDYNKCIMCTCCVRACEEMVTASAIDIELRGFHSQIACAFDDPLAKSSCIFCGQCIMVCPVGALTSKVAAGRGRAYETEKHVSTCAFCGTGCTIKVQTLKGKTSGIDSLRDAEQSPVNQGMLCGKGRFGWDFAVSDKRLQRPLVDGSESSWDEAIAVAAKAIAASGNIGVLVSSHATYEEMRKASAFATGIKADYLDDTSPLSQMVILPMMEATGLASGSLTIKDIENDSDVIVVAGADAWLSHPVLAMKIRRKAADGSLKLVVVDSRPSALAKKADVFIQCEAGTEATRIAEIAGAIFTGGSQTGHGDNFNAYQTSLPTSDDALIKKAAEVIASAGACAFVYGGDTGDATYRLGSAVCNLAIATGNFNRAGAGILPLTPSNNGAGAAIAGLSAFGGERGFDAALRAAAAGNLDTLIVLGENPKPYGVSEELWVNALKSVKTLIIEEMFADEYRGFAKVILPGACYLEKAGTFVNIEGRSQKVLPAAKPPGEAKCTRAIINLLAEAGNIELAIQDEVIELGLPQALRTQKLLAPELSLRGSFPKYQPGICPGFFYHNAGMIDCSLSFKFQKSEV